MLVVVLILGAVVVSGVDIPELLKRQATTAINGQNCLNPENYARDTVCIPDLRFMVNAKLDKLKPKLQNTTGCIPRLSTNPDGSCPVSAFQQVRFSPSA